MPWLENANKIGEWGDTGENDRIIRKTNLTSARWKRKPSGSDRVARKDDNILARGH